MADDGLNVAARDRLLALLAAYGADPARWPEGDRALASWLANASPSLLAPLEDARSLDAVLAHGSHPTASASAAERLIARVDEGSGKVVSMARRGQARPGARHSVLPGRLAVATALAASLALGLYLGATGQTDWLAPALLADEAPEYPSADLAVLDATLLLFEDHTEP